MIVNRDWQVVFLFFVSRLFALFLANPLPLAVRPTNGGGTCWSSSKFIPLNACILGYLCSRISVFSGTLIREYINSRAAEYSFRTLVYELPIFWKYPIHIWFVERLFFEIFFEFLFLFISPRSNCLNFFILSLITLEDIRISEYPKFPRFNRRKKVCIFAWSNETYNFAVSLY